MIDSCLVQASSHSVVSADCSNAWLSTPDTTSFTTKLHRIKRVACIRLQHSNISKYIEDASSELALCYNALHCSLPRDQGRLPIETAHPTADVINKCWQDF